MILTLLLLAAAPAPLPDLPAPLGRLDGVLAEGTDNDRTVELALPGCDKKVPVNLSRFVAGSAYAMQQMVEWLNGTAGLAIFPPGALDEVTAAVSTGAFSDTKACRALPKEPAKAPKLCPGAAPDQAWTVLPDGKPAALIRMEKSASKTADRCLPRLTAVFFDRKGVARVRYDADFGAAAGGALVGDAKCQVTFGFDPKAEVFHASRRGCKGP